MSLVTVSAKRNRIYERAFDHDEAQRLRAEGWSYNALAERFGVSATAVERVCDPRIRARQDAQTKRWLRRNRRSPCKGGCGRLVWVMGNRSGYCPSCHGLRRATTVRADTLLCGRCGEWKPDEQFQRRSDANARRQRASECRPCSTLARRERRQRNPLQEHAANERAKAKRRRRRRSKVNMYVVLQPNGAGWVERERVSAVSAQHAIEQVATEPGEFVAVLSTRFKPMRVETVQALKVVAETEAPIGGVE